MNTILTAVIQGLTEYLPISSSGHLLLLHEHVTTRTHDVLLDIAGHVGTFFAGIVFFRRQVVQIARGIRDVASRRNSEAASLAINLLVATLPLILVGAILQQTGWYETILRSVLLLALSNLVFAVALFGGWVSF